LVGTLVVLFNLCDLVSVMFTCVSCRIRIVESELKVAKPWSKIRSREVEEVGEEITKGIFF